jgi:uncharacterized integral membrane protein
MTQLALYFGQRIVQLHALQFAVIIKQMVLMVIFHFVIYKNGNTATCPFVPLFIKMATLPLALLFLSFLTASNPLTYEFSASPIQVSDRIMTSIILTPLL